jgi:hypothetical protein
MFNMLKTAVLSAMIGLGGLAAMPASAHADGIYLNFGGSDDARMGVFVQDGRYDGRRDRWDRHDRHDRRDRWERREHRRACTPDRALDKADRMGLRRARVVDVSRRTITVSGRKWHDRVHVTFARAPNCPVIR